MAIINQLLSFPTFLEFLEIPHYVGMETNLFFFNERYLFLVTESFLSNNWARHLPSEINLFLEFLCSNKKLSLEIWNNWQNHMYLTIVKLYQPNVNMGKKYNHVCPLLHWHFGLPCWEFWKSVVETWNVPRKQKNISSFKNAHIAAKFPIMKSACFPAKMTILSKIST